MCEDAGVPVAVLTLLVYVMRRLKPPTVALVMFEAWRRLPPRHRQQLLLAARRNGPRVAASIIRRGRPRF
jgi:hypothetical protein